MDFVIRHRLPGRLRISVPWSADVSAWLERAAQWLRGLSGVTYVRPNSWCRSIVIEYRVMHRAESRLVEAIACFDSTTRVPQAEQEKEAYDEPQVPRTFAVATAAFPLSLMGPLFAPLAIGCILYSAWPSFTRAFEVWRREHRLNVDFLDSLAIIISLLRRSFFAGALMTWLIGLGDAIRDRTAARSRRAIEDLLHYQSDRCWLVRDGEKIEVEASSLEQGDVVVVYAGSLIPVDGQVLKGAATVDQKMVTGESMPVEKKRGTSVYAGTALQEGQIYIRATRVGSETTVARIVKMVRDAPVGETRVQNYAEKFADRLVAPSLAVSCGLYALSGNAERFLSMVIVDYGTGIRVAAPTTILASMLDAARRGVLIKSGSDIEKLSAADTVVLDKTGTITRGVPKVGEVFSFDTRHFPPHKIIALAAASEARLKHPVAQAIVSKARQEGIDFPARHAAHFRIGLGVESQVDGYQVHVGNERFLREKGIRVAPARSELARYSQAGCSTLFLAVDGKLVGLLPYADEIRTETPSVVHQLHQRGLREVIMLTGDNGIVAEAVARRVGLDRFFAEVLPAEKAEIVRGLQRQGHVVTMVGDGINDSPALAYADVGVSVKNGTDVTREVANVVLMDDNLNKLITAIDVAKNAMHLIRQNYAIIAGLNTLALALSIPTGLVSPGITALISNGSAILASVNAIRPILKY